MAMSTAELHCAPAPALTADCCPSLDSAQAPPEGLNSQELGPGVQDRVAGSVPGADIHGGSRGDGGVRCGPVPRSRPLLSLLL
jgi:hypothetical protein